MLINLVTARDDKWFLLLMCRVILKVARRVTVRVYGEWILKRAFSAEDGMERNN
ncbi:MAG: hypothetical protein ACI8Z1_003855 [Candidatus Azotimanducaceae bacterium]|jgi:hypothetical protein